MKQTEKMYMNAETVNAVELGEVFEVYLNDEGEWVEGEFMKKSIFRSKSSGAFYDVDKKDTIFIYRKETNDYYAEYTVEHEVFKTVRDALNFLKDKPYRCLYAFKSEIEYMGEILEPIEDYMFDYIK